MHNIVESIIAPVKALFSLSLVLQGLHIISSVGQISPVDSISPVGGSNPSTFYQLIFFDIDPSVRLRPVPDLFCRFLTNQVSEALNVSCTIGLRTS
jgi:hypothetical protein